MTKPTVQNLPLRSSALNLCVPTLREGEAPMR